MTLCTYYNCLRSRKWIGLSEVNRIRFAVNIVCPFTKFMKYFFYFLQISRLKCAHLKAICYINPTRSSAIRILLWRIVYRQLRGESRQCGDRKCDPRRMISSVIGMVGLYRLRYRKTSNTRKTRAVAWKPCDAAAVLFGLKFADDIHYKFKSSNATSNRGFRAQTYRQQWRI